jgi:hypothetical protein
MVMMDMRYMWSEILSPLSIPKRRQPSRGVVFRRSRRWKKGMGDWGFVGMEIEAVERARRCQRWGLRMREL